MRGSGRRAPLRDVASAGVRSTAGEAAAPGLEATGLRKGPHESALAPARPASSRGQLPCGEGGARGRARGRRAATGSVVPSAGGRGRELWTAGHYPHGAQAQLGCSREADRPTNLQKNSAQASLTAHSHDKGASEEFPGSALCAVLLKSLCGGGVPPSSHPSLACVLSFFLSCSRCAQPARSSLSRHWARDWRALALTQVHHGSRGETASAAGCFFHSFVLFS